MPQIHIIRVDGTEEHIEGSGQGSRELREQLMAELNVPLGFDFVNLRDGRLMWVDDTGYVDKKPVNPKATELYHSVCIPGTTHPICGDVAITREERDADNASRI